MKKCKKTCEIFAWFKNSAYLCIAFQKKSRGVAQPGLEYASGGRVVASSNLVTPTKKSVETGCNPTIATCFAFAPALLLRLLRVSGFWVSGFSRWADVVSRIECGQPEHEEFYIADTPELRSECFYRVNVISCIVLLSGQKQAFFCLACKTKRRMSIYFCKVFFCVRYRESGIIGSSL